MARKRKEATDILIEMGVLTPEKAALAIEDAKKFHMTIPEADRPKSTPAKKT